MSVNPEGIKSATALAHSKALQSRVTFLLHNAATHLPFADATFDAVYSNDAMCHIPDRLPVLREFLRVLKRGGRFLFSDALVITGVISDAELVARSSIGHYLFVPGENERLLEQSGFHLLRCADTTPSAAAIAKRRHDGRAHRQSTLLPIEGQSNFDGLQRFLGCVHKLAHEQRLSTSPLSKLAPSFLRRGHFFVGILTFPRTR